MIDHIVNELMDNFDFWSSPYAPLWSSLCEVSSLFLLMLAILVPLLFVYHIIKIFWEC